ncbi:MAG: hypothetical protein ACT4PT_13545 [Methanobacteriota archaeon]
MSLEDRVARVWNDPERRADFLFFAWILSLLMLLLGYAIIAWKLKDAFPL